MDKAVKERVTQTLQELLDRMVVCDSEHCFVCKGVKSQVEALAAALDIEADAIMPHRLRGVHNE